MSNLDGALSSEIGVLREAVEEIHRLARRLVEQRDQAAAEVQRQVEALRAELAEVRALAEQAGRGQPVAEPAPAPAAAEAPPAGSLDEVRALAEDARVHAVKVGVGVNERFAELQRQFEKLRLEVLQVSENQEQHEAQLAWDLEHLERRLSQRLDALEPPAE